MCRVMISLFLWEDCVTTLMDYCRTCNLRGLSYCMLIHVDLLLLIVGCLTLPSPTIDTISLCLPWIFLPWLPLFDASTCLNLLTCGLEYGLAKLLSSIVNTTVGISILEIMLSNKMNNMIMYESCQHHCHDLVIAHRSLASYKHVIVWIQFMDCLCVLNLLNLYHILFLWLFNISLWLPSTLSLIQYTLVILW